MDINAAGGSKAGIEHSTFQALGTYQESPLFTEAEKAALAYADSITLGGTVPDEVFAAVQNHYNEDEIVEMTATITWENFSARFNRALQVSAAGLYGGGSLDWVTPSDW